MEEGMSFWRGVWRELCRRRLIRVCLWVIAAFTLVAVYGEVVYRYYQAVDRTPSYQQVNLSERYLPPSLFRHPFEQTRHTAGESAFGRVWRGFGNLAYRPWGTDNLGRDVLQRTVQGARIAFLVGIVTSLIAIPIGMILGCVAGYFGRWVDEGIVWLYSTMESIPGLLFILAISMVVGKGLLGVYMGIGLTTWVGLCRLLRAEVMKHRDRTYVMAARSLGYGNGRIIFRHILPNVFHIVIITFSIRFPAAIGTEVFMSFLGIGVQGEPSWGIMIGNARLRLWQGMWWELTAVTVVILAVVLAFNLVGDALRDALDPRSRERES
jgi:peptide/nickel transport system permease protein